MAINFGNYNHNHYCHNHITTAATIRTIIENVGQQSQQELHKYSKQPQQHQQQELHKYQQYHHYINYNQKYCNNNNSKNSAITSNNNNDNRHLRYHQKCSIEKAQLRQDQRNDMVQRNGKTLQIIGQYFNKNDNNNTNDYYDDITNVLPSTTIFSVLFDTEQITSTAEEEQQLQSWQQQQQQQHILYTINSQNTNHTRLSCKNFNTLENCSTANGLHSIYFDDARKTKAKTTITKINILKILSMISTPMSSSSLSLSSVATTTTTITATKFCSSAVKKFNNPTKNSNNKSHFKKSLELNNLHNLCSYTLLIFLSWNLIVHAAIATSVTTTNKNSRNFQSNNHNYYPNNAIVVGKISSIAATSSLPSSPQVFVAPLSVKELLKDKSRTTITKERERQIIRKSSRTAELISALRNVTNRRRQTSSLSSLSKSLIKSTSTIATLNLSAFVGLRHNQNVLLQNPTRNRKHQPKTTAVTLTLTPTTTTTATTSKAIPLAASTSQTYKEFQLTVMERSNLTTITTIITTTISTPIQPLYNVTYNVRRSMLRRDTANNANNVPDYDDNEFTDYNDEDNEYDALIHNKSAKGKYIGAPCNDMKKCETSLIHVTCDRETNTCGCEKNYPVQLGLIKGCDKPKKLGEQCFYDETCQYNDENSLCIQVRHNAMCQCVSGFHSVSYTKPTKRVFCTQDLDELNSDLPTLLGVCLGIGVLAGLICMVLHLFSKTKYPRHRNFGDANLPPPIMYSSETVQSGRPSSRSSIRSSGGSIGSYGNRRSFSTIGGVGGGAGTSSSNASKGILVSTSRTGAARSAAILLISSHLSAMSKQNSPASSRQTSATGGCSANSRDNLNDNDNNYSSTYPNSRSCDSTLSMTRHLQKQLNHQRYLLSFELSPAKTKNHDKIRALLGLNGIENYRTDDDNFTHLENGGDNYLEIGALPTPASQTPRFAKTDDREHEKHNGTQLHNRSRRPSLASVHSTSSSIRSYSMMRFEKEQQQKEIRQEMKLRLARLQQHQQQHQQQQHLSQHKPQIIIGDSVMVMQRGVTLNRITMATPSPLTPNSTDELLPAVDESQEYLTKFENNANKANVAPSEPSGIIASTTLTTLNRALTTSALSKKINKADLIAETNIGSTSNVDAAAAATATVAAIGASAATGYIGPCSSSNETL